MSVASVTNQCSLGKTSVKQCKSCFCVPGMFTENGVFVAHSKPTEAEATWIVH